MAKRLDEKFTNDIRAALDRHGVTSLLPIVSLIAFLVGGFIFWAHHAVLEEVTSGLGKIVPSSQMQLVQPFESGIVQEISVHEGDTVNAGDILLVLDDTEFASQLGELTTRAASLELRRFRLSAEANLQQPAFDTLQNSNLLQEEVRLHNARMVALNQEQSDQ